MATPAESPRFADVRRFSEIDSTNRYLLDEARRGAPDGVVAVADYQHAGRGRRDRTWTAPPGASLLMSVLLRPHLPPDRLHLVTMAAALATGDAVRCVAGFEPTLKWPNDLLAGERKLAGLLAEADVAGGEVQAVVVGIGVNVSWNTVPRELAETATACNIVAGRPVDRDRLMVELLERLDAWLGNLQSVPRGARGRLSTLGRRVRVEQAHEIVVGVARDVDDHGRLVVERDDGAVIAVAVGDVVHLRTP